MKLQLQRDKNCTELRNKNRLFKRAFTKRVCFICRFFVSPYKTRLGLVKFGRDAGYVEDLKFSQKRSGRQQMVEKMVNRMPDVLDSITNLEKGLKMAFDAHKEYDTIQNTKNDRTDAKNVVIVFTDGKTYNESAVTSMQKVMYQLRILFVNIAPVKVGRVQVHPFTLSPGIIFFTLFPPVHNR